MTAAQLPSNMVLSLPALQWRSSLLCKLSAATSTRRSQTSPPLSGKSPLTSRTQNPVFPGGLHNFRCSETGTGDDARHRSRCPRSCQANQGELPSCSGDDIEAKSDEIVVSCPTSGPIDRYDKFIDAVRELPRRKISEAVKKRAMAVAESRSIETSIGNLVMAKAPCSSRLILTLPKAWGFCAIYLWMANGLEYDGPSLPPVSHGSRP
jgi:hypothetical protein